MLPSSFSLSALRPNSDPDKRSRKTPRRRSSLDLLKLHLHEHPHRPAVDDAAETQGPVQQEPILLSSKEHPAGEAVPPPSRLRSKSKTWSARVSSFLPPLISHNVDPSSQPISRKPLSTTSPTEPPPPPPYDLHESPTAALSNDSFGNSVPVEARSAHTPPPTGLGLHPNSTMMSLPELDMGELSLSGSGNPQIMAPIPPSPETKRATLMKQEPVTLTEARRGSDDATKQGKLHKENRDSRRRSNSLQQPQLSDLQPSLAASGTSPIPEPRGRRSISAQTPSITTDVAPGLPVASSPVNPRSLSAKDGSQSPSRGKLRRSWLPGGGRSRSNSVDVSNGSKSDAWVMSDDAAQAEYNSTFLKNGEKVNNGSFVQVNSDEPLLTPRFAGS